MAEVLAEIRAGKFTAELSREEASGYVRLERAREEARSTLLEKTFEKLREIEG